ncbi:Fc.00g101770.m01.CDS01 [Cosmosporella sp. VM-42]
MRSPRPATRSQVQTIRTALRGRRDGIVDSLLSIDEDRGLGGYLPSVPEAELGDLLDAEIKTMHENVRAARRKRKEKARNERLTQGPVRTPPQESTATVEKRVTRSMQHK